MMYSSFCFLSFGDEGNNLSLPCSTDVMSLSYAFIRHETVSVSVAVADAIPPVPPLLPQL